MKSLREYTIKLDQTEMAPANRGTTWGGAFPTPIHGTVNGVPARAITPGDLPGASTVLLCADQTGFLAEVKRTDFIVTDGAFLPLQEPK